MNKRQALRFIRGAVDPSVDFYVSSVRKVERVSSEERGACHVVEATVMAADFKGGETYPLRVKATKCKRVQILGR